MKLEVLADAETVAERAAAIIAAEAKTAVAARGRFIIAISGGSTPWAMLRALAVTPMPWADVHLVQVDERVAATGDVTRNFTHIEQNLLAQAPLPPAQVHAMPVAAPDLDQAAESYALTLREVAGSPPVIDLVHLGLGADGHTASLVPGDPVLAATGEVALSGIYQDRRRMTLTYPAINRARRILWLVTGADKAAMLARLINGDRSIPAGRVRQDASLLLADSAAAARLNRPH